MNWKMELHTTFRRRDGTTGYSVKRDIDEMKKGIRQIRRRAGVPDYTIPEYQDREVFRKKLKHERMIEVDGRRTALFRFAQMERCRGRRIQEKLRM